eukprot:1852129-Rhodomonas_salina.1
MPANIPQHLAHPRPRKHAPTRQHALSQRKFKAELIVQRTWDALEAHLADGLGLKRWDLGAAADLRDPGVAEVHEVLLRPAQLPQRRVVEPHPRLPSPHNPAVSAARHSLEPQVASAQHRRDHSKDNKKRSGAEGGVREAREGGGDARLELCSDVGGAVGALLEGEVLDLAQEEVLVVAQEQHPGPVLARARCTPKPVDVLCTVRRLPDLRGGRGEVRLREHDGEKEGCDER